MYVQFYDVLLIWKEILEMYIIRKFTDILEAV